MLEALTTPRGTFERLDEIQLVDCREQYEWDAGRVEGAIHLPLNDDHGRRRLRPGYRQAGRRDLPQRQPQRARHHDAAGSRVRGLQPRGRHGGLGARGPARTQRPTARPAASPDVRTQAWRATGGARCRSPSYVVDHDLVHAELEQHERTSLRIVTAANAARDDERIAGRPSAVPRSANSPPIAVVVVHHRVQRVARIALQVGDLRRRVGYIRT